MAHPTGIEQLLAFFAVVHAPRRQHATTWPPLETILTLTILATICGAQNGVEIAHWGHAKAAWLSAFLDLTHGMPSHDTFGRVCALLDSSSLQQAFASWMQALADLRQAIVALDGKTLRRSLDRADGKGPIPIVNAWSSANALVLAQFKVDAKTNEITALPALLRMLNLTGAVVTIDAMGCQGEIARQMQEQGAEYMRSVKEHQPTFYSDCVDVFAWLRSPQPLAHPVTLGYAAQVDGDHGRSEIRRVWSTPIPEGLESCTRGPGLPSLVLVESIRQLGEAESVEQRYDISSLPGTTHADAQRAHRVIRTHWESEHRVHWVRDVAMGEDNNRTRNGESAQNLALIRKLALNVLRQEPSAQGGIAAKQKRAGWDQAYLLKILSLT
jgi:predicted transposase YbfD/YdcC